MFLLQSTPLVFSATLFFGSVLNAESSVKIEILTRPVELAEGPHWNFEDRKLYYVDINGQKIMRYNPKTTEVTSAYLNCGHAGIVIPVDGARDKFIVGCEKDIVLVTWNPRRSTLNPKIQKLVGLDVNRNSTRVNDGKCDPVGRLVVGTMAIKVNGFVKPNQGSLYSIDENLNSVTLLSPVTISNGLTWNSRHDVLYYIDSDTYQIWAFDYEILDGSIRNKRVVFDVKEQGIKGLPDGMTIDTDDNLWIALMFGGAVIQVDPREGKLLRIIRFPVDRISSVAFGDPKLDTLYVTSARDEMTEEDLQLEPLSGCLFSVKGLKVRAHPAINFKLNHRFFY